MYKEVVSIHIDLGRFTTAAKMQKEIGELYEADADSEKAIEAFQTAADYYQAEENHSTANQMLLKVEGEKRAMAEDMAALRERAAKAENALVATQTGARKSIKEVIAQRQALQQRVQALERGLGGGGTSQASYGRKEVQVLCNR